MTETTDGPWAAAEPWPTYFGDEPSEVNDPLAAFLPPDIVTARRAAILERQTQQHYQREEAEREAQHQQAHDNYAHLWMQARRFELAFRGRDPNNPANLPRSVDELAARAFLQQDFEIAEATEHAKAKARQVLREANVLGQVTLNVAPSPLPPSPGVDGSPPASRSRGRPAASGVNRATPLGVKVRAAFDRWATRSAGHPSTACRCAACDPDALRADAEAGLQPREMTRFYERARVR